MTYKPFDLFCFRFPLLSYNYIEENCNCDFLKDYFDQKKWQEAIYLSSPVLYKELNKLFKNPSSKKDNQQISYALNRYIYRMSTRCTPFGLFAGCGIGKTGEQTTILLNEKMERTTRLDMLYLCALYDKLVKNTEIQQQLTYYLNTTLYPIGKKYRYIEWKYVKTNRKHDLTEIEQSPFLKKILEKAVTGAKRSDLVESLIDNKISREVAEEFINDLIDAQLLVGELNQSIMGDDYFTRLVTLIESFGNNTQSLLPMRKIRSLLNELDNGNKKVEFYETIILPVKKLGVSYKEQFLFQVDMTNKPEIASLGKEVINELQSVMAFLNKITPNNENETLTIFKEAFQNRYENREIPLMEALDPELGIGYPVKNNSNVPSPLVDDLALPSKKEKRTFVRDPFHMILHKKAIECIANHKQEIIFTDQDIKDLPIHWDNLPPTIYTKLQVIRAKPENILLKLNSFGGSSAANLLARFAHTNKKIHHFIKEITNKEQALIPDAILAEIVHLPESRAGNVLCRPHLREYEILYMATSDLPKDRLFEISDLLLSMQNDELIIRSKKSGKRIIPRLTTAHNYRENSLPAYRFLCEMQISTERGGIIFDWGYFDYPFRPRIRYSNTVLSLATWTFENKEIEHLYTIKNDTILISKIKEWRALFSLPRYMLMPDSDNELFIDWDNPLNVRSLFFIIKNKASVVFTEFLFEPENAIIRDKKDKPYLNECIVTFYKDTKK